MPSCGRGPTCPIWLPGWPIVSSRSIVRRSRAAPAIPPGVRRDVDFPVKPGFTIAAGGTVVDYDVAVPPDGILHVRTQTADGVAGSVGYTWLREAS